MSKRFDNLDTESKQDADETAFFLRELEHIKSRTFDILFPELKARSVIPVAFDAGEWAESITYRQFDKRGQAKVIANYGADLPRVDVLGREFTQKVKSLGDSYGFNVQEVRAAAHTPGKSLDQKRADAARRAAMELENSLAFFGDPIYGFTGWFANANITDVVIPNDGAGATTEWANKTPDQIIRDMNLLARTVHSVSKGIESADTLLLPLEQYNLVFDTPRSAQSDKSVGVWFLENSPHIKSIDWLNELDGAGAGGSDLMIAYKRSPDKFSLEVPKDYEVFPVQERGLEFIVPAHLRHGGVLIYYPLSQAKGDGI